MNKINLNLGSGNRVLPDFINIDFVELKCKLPAHTQYLQMDVFNLSTYFVSGTVDMVRASHFFEHLTHSQILTLMYKIWDILKFDGVLEITTPDFFEILKIYQRKHTIGDFNDLDLLHTKIFNTEDETFHKSVWTKEIGIYYITREGFFSTPEISKPSPMEITFITRKK